MATIRPIGKGSGKRYQAMVRKTVAGEKHHLSRVFWKSKEAEDWARRCEDAIVSSTPDRPFIRLDWAEQTDQSQKIDDDVPQGGWTITQAMDLYKETVTDHRKGAVEDGYRVAFWKGRLGKKTLTGLTVADVQAVITERLKARSGDTVRREVNVLRGLFRYAKEEWGISTLANLTDLKLPSPAPHRERRLEDGHGDAKGEEDRLKAALATWKRNPEIRVQLFQFALETGLRLSEAHALTVANIKRTGGITRVELGDSKNDDPRKVVLSSTAQAIAEHLARGQPAKVKLFRISDSARKRVWAYARKKAEVVDLRWHDLRHEAISRMAGLNLHLGELMAQSGHRDVESLKRYTNARASDIKRKLG